VAISHHRLLALEDSQLTFQWKDYRSEHREKSKTVTLDVEEFMPRFRIHTLPAGFQRIRNYDFLASFTPTTGPKSPPPAFALQETRAPTDQTPQPRRLNDGLVHCAIASACSSLVCAPPRVFPPQSRSDLFRSQRFCPYSSTTWQSILPKPC
jgi:hypothetical protein